MRKIKAKLIPISAAREIAEKYGCTIAAIVAWDSKTGVQHVTTYGKSVEECAWAADLGNQIKQKVLRWPEEHCHARPKRDPETRKDRGCKLPPEGWYCTREPGHEGPCAALERERCSGYGCTRYATHYAFCASCWQDYKEDPDSMK